MYIHVVPGPPADGRAAPGSFLTVNEAFVAACPPAAGDPAVKVTISFAPAVLVFQVEGAPVPFSSHVTFPFSTLKRKYCFI